jgi:hypothetical protein
MPPITVDPPTPPRIVAKDPNKLTKPSVAERLASNRTAPVAKVSKEPQSKE